MKYICLRDPMEPWRLGDIISKHILSSQTISEILIGEFSVYTTIKLWFQSSLSFPLWIRNGDSGIGSLSEGIHAALSIYRPMKEGDYIALGGTQAILGMHGVVGCLEVSSLTHTIMPAYHTLLPPQKRLWGVLHPEDFAPGPEPDAALPDPPWGMPKWAKTKVYQTSPLYGSFSVQLGSSLDDAFAANPVVPIHPDEKFETPKWFVPIKEEDYAQVGDWIVHRKYHAVNGSTPHDCYYQDDSVKRRVHQTDYNHEKYRFWRPSEVYVPYRLPLNPFFSHPLPLP